MNTTPRRHLFHPFVRRRRGTLPRVVAVVLTLAMLASGLAYRPATARADSACTIDLSGNVTSCPPPALLNTSLLSPLSGSLYVATPAQTQSLQNLETEAISDTIQDHDLPASDAVAVQTWGRDDAEAELFALLVQAIQTAPISRTTDQQNAVAWLSAVVQRNNVQAADDAGLEYVKWAGLDQTKYQNLLASNPSESSVQSFLAANDEDPTGYCAYRSPAPDQSDYTGYQAESCIEPCNNALTSCIPNPPSYDNFVKWGAADADYANLTSNGFAAAAKSIGLDLTAGVAAVTIGLRLTSAGFSLALAASAADTLGAAAASVAAVIGPVGLVLFVLVAIADAVVSAINLANALALPGQLATLITSAPTTTPDLGAMLADQNQAASLLSLFVGATLPTPRAATCDNSLVVNIGSTIGVPCLNAPTIPAPVPDDPDFAIQARGATTTDANSISWTDATTGITTTARLSGHWFVDQVTNPDGTTTDVAQTLDMHYTDWSGQGRTAWLYGDPTGGYKFLGIADQSASGPSFSPSTCLADQTCAYTSTIDYVGTDGQDYSAKVIPATSLLPAVNPSTSANPLEGSPVTFNANGSSPVGATPLTYQWRFEVPGSTTITGCGDPPCYYGSPVSGAQVSNTWTTSGNFRVQLTATDAQHRSTVDTFVVSIGDVPPTLALAPSCPHLPSCDAHTVPLSSATSLDATIIHAGADDSESASVQWGDGSTDSTRTSSPGVIVINPGPLYLTPSSSTAIALSDTHTYTAAGTYPVTVTVSDQSGATAVVTTKETVQATPVVTWPAPAPITYGTALGSAQLDATASATTTLSGSTASVPGTFAYSVDGNPVSASDRKVLPAGAHALTVRFTPEDTTLYTTPGPVSVPLTVHQAPLTITANDQTTPYGKVPTVTWTGTGWVNGESASTLATAPNSAPACSATVGGAPESSTTPPGVYPGAIACQGAVDPNYTFSYVSGTLTINPLLSLDEQGLPGSVAHQATLDGYTVNLPDANVEVAYGSTHSYSFPASVTDTGSGTVYFTADQGFSGAVTANISDTAVYQTMDQIVGAALSSGGVDNGGQANALTQQFAAVQADIAAGNTAQALADIESFAAHVRAQSGKHIATATAQALLADAQSLYASLGGTGTV